jgi:hypothetical protein
MEHPPRHPAYHPDFPPIAPDVPWLTRDWAWDTPPPQLLGRILVLQCPVCGFFYNHHDQVAMLDKPHQGWTGDGALLEVGFSCENGHCWALNFDFHKGQMYVYATCAGEHLQPNEDADQNGNANASPSPEQT